MFLSFTINEIQELIPNMRNASKPPSELYNDERFKFTIAQQMYEDIDQNNALQKMRDQNVLSKLGDFSDREGVVDEIWLPVIHGDSGMANNSEQ